MDFYVIMERPGMRVARRKRKAGRVGAPHRVTKEETVAWFKKRVGFYLISNIVSLTV